MATTRDRILAAAAQIFGRKGYKAATVRDICAAADVNSAALNYHFGNKETLYRTVVTDLLEKAFMRYPVDTGVSAAAAPEIRLKAFIRGFLLRLLAPGGMGDYQGQHRLLTRELADPSPVLDHLVQDYMRPQALILTGIITDLVGADMPQENIMLGAFSVIGQCIHYGYAWPIIMRLNPMNLSDPSVIDRLSDHITEFSLGGLKKAVRQAS